jgi:hypothetical protein
MIIRKISIGPDYMNAMHYSVGQSVLDKSYSIYVIKENKDNDIDIYIIRKDEVVLWKRISSTVPKSIEFKIDF